MAKKKIKKLIKKVAPLLAVAGLGKAFMDARNRKAMLEGADANEGFRIPFSKPNMRDIAGPAFIEPKMMTAKDMAEDPMFINAETLMNDERMFKKGGRVKKTKGFSKTKKKQASRMRKK